MIRIATLLALLAGAPAHALSCLPPDALRLYDNADQSEDFYAIVTGRLQPDGDITIPEVDVSNQKNAEATTRVRMSGKVLGSTDFAQEFEREIDVTITCLSNGWFGEGLDAFRISAAVVLGENIGTTVTAWLASLGANTDAKRAARAHFLFNVIGTIWMLIVFWLFTHAKAGPSFSSAVTLHMPKRTGKSYVRSSASASRLLGLISIPCGPSLLLCFAPGRSWP